MFVIGYKLFEVFLRTVGAHSLKTDVYMATVCKHSNCSWFAGLCKVCWQVPVC